MLPPVGTPALQAEALVRDFGSTRAVDGVDFHLEAGKLLTLFGPNGAGKSTVLALLAGSLRPTSGQVRIDGLALDAPEQPGRGRVGVLSHNTFLYARLSARENLRFYGTLYGVPDLADRVAERLEAVGLTDRSDAQVSTYSRGMRQRLALARTLLHDPEIVLLDEPYTGLDAHAADTLNSVLASLKDGRRTVVLVTHHLAQGLALSDQFAIQVQGRFVHQGLVGDVEPVTFARFYREQVDGAL